MGKWLNKNTLAILIGMLMLCFWAFFNRYPLSYFDTTAYFESGFLSKVPADRPIFYGLFIEQFGFRESAWFIIFTQALIISYLLFLNIKAFGNFKQPYLAHLAIIGILVPITGVSIHVSQLIPDIFTASLFLAVIPLFLAKNLTRFDQILVFILFFFSLLVHNSHLIILASGLGIFSFYGLWRLFRKQLTWQHWLFKKLAKGWLSLFFAWLTISSTHYAFGGGFVVTSGSHAFLMNKLLEIGVLDHYLNKACEESPNSYKICAYKDNMSTDYLWDPNSPFHKIGGWEGSKTEHYKIIGNIISTPYYWKKLISKSAIGTINQFFLFESGDTPAGAGPHVRSAIKRFFKGDLREYNFGLQQNNFGLLHDTWTSLNERQRLFIFFSLLLASLALLSGRLQRPHYILLLAVFLFLWVNAFSCASFSSLSGRYQSRIIWCLPFYLFIIGYQYIPLFLKKVKTYIHNL